MSLVQLKTELRQELKLTPQLMQSMEVLQMTSQELLEYIGRMTEENPLLDQSDAPEQAYEALRRQASWIDGGLGQRATFSHEDGTISEPGRADRELEGLAAFLRDQLARKGLPKPLLALTKYLAELVDEDGYLVQEDIDSLLELKIPEKLIGKALTVIQGLDPAGVGARSLSECLLLQLTRKKGSPAAREIAANYLTELGRKHYGAIAQKSGLGFEDVQAAAVEIAALDPHPGRAFQPEEVTVYVRPDIFVAELEGKLQVILNDYYLPRVSVNDYYVRLLKESDEEGTRSYLKQKLQQAKWLLDSLERRGGTLRRCAEAILEVQRPFFTGETSALAPMTLSALAGNLELHPSTVSRAVRGKYLQCRQGTYPLRYFCSLPVSGTSRQAVKQRILTLIRDEDPARPFSDARLVQLLESEGVHVARRTVAKYRIELGLGSSAARKHRGN